MVTDKQYTVRLTECFALAVSKAVELEYSVETMKITLSPGFAGSPGPPTLEVHFAPIPQPGVFVLGGAVTVEVDLVGQEITEVTTHQ